MKKKYSGLIGILFLTLACGLINPATPTPIQPAVETLVTETLQAITANVPTPTTQSGISVSFKNVSFVIPEGLASGANSELVPAVVEDGGAPWDIAPEHIVFSLNGYLDDSSDGIHPTIMIFPAKEYANSNAGAGISLPLLQTILANPSAPVNIDTAPAVPYFNAGQIMIAQSGIINFQSGSGLRTITHYSQFVSPIIKVGQFYHYQGLTAGGKYYIVAVIHIISPLQSTSENPSTDNVPFPDFSTASPEEISTYYQAMTDLLNAASPESFQPSLTQLDALIQSITVSSP